MAGVGLGMAGLLMVVLKRMGLPLLLGGIGVELLALAWLITFAATNGAAPIPVAPEAPPTRALVLMVVGFVAIAPGASRPRSSTRQPHAGRAESTLLPSSSSDRSPGLASVGAAGSRVS